MMTADNTATEQTYRLAIYLEDAVRKWAVDFEVQMPVPMPAAMIMLVESFSAYAQEPTRENLANLLASSAGLSGAIADLYQFPGDTDPG